MGMNHDKRVDDEIKSNRRKKSKKVLSSSPLRQNDAELALFDAALTASEDILRPLLRCYSAESVAEAFKQHAQIHVAEELVNIATHGHRNDSPDDRPAPSIYDDLLNLAQLVEAGNTEFDGLERNAAAILNRIKTLQRL